MTKTILISILLFLCFIFYAQANMAWKIISIPTYPEVWVTKKDIVIEGRLSAWGGGLGTVVKVVISKGAKVYFNE